MLHNQENYDVTGYFLDIQLTDTSTFIFGSSTVSATILEDADSLVLNLGNQLEVSRVEVNNLNCTFSHREELLHISSSQFRKKNKVNIKIIYSGDGDHSKDYGAIFNREYKPHGWFTFTLTEPFSAKHWFPCKEILTDKADSVFVYVTVPKGLKVGSNGLLKKVIPINDTHVQYQWESRYPTAFYLVSVALGNYLDYSGYISLAGVNDSLPFVNYVFNSKDFLQSHQQSIDTTIALMHLFSDLFGEYPFAKEKYGHCIVPLGGGMEHQTMTTLGNFGFDLVSHELAHQWFGNSVTCASWNDIWVNEGFASYAEYLAREFLGDKEGAHSWMEYAHQTALNSNINRVYVPDDELNDPTRIFSYSTTYKKGAAILHMLRYELESDSLFFSVIKKFLADFAYRNASTDDFLSIVESTSGKSFKKFFNQWYYGTGHPILDVEWYQRGDTLSITTYQTPSDENADIPFELSLEFNAICPDGDTTLNTSMTKMIHTSKFILTGKVVNLVVDPQNIILKRIKSIIRKDSNNNQSMPSYLSENF